jgi:hypothetical protein
MEHIEAHPDLPWNWSLVFVNKNLTFEVIHKHIHKCYVVSLFDHLLIESKKQFIRKREREDNLVNLELVKRDKLTFPTELFEFVSDFL